MVRDSRSRFRFQFPMKTFFKVRIRRAISSLRLVMSLLCHRQYLKVCGVSLWFLALLLILGWRAPECSAQQIRVVPSISVVEQYDTNVFFAPKSQLPAGKSADDLISIFTPQLNFIQGNSLVK